MCESPHVHISECAHDRVGCVYVCVCVCVYCRGRSNCNVLSILCGHVYDLYIYIYMIIYVACIYVYGECYNLCLCE